MPGNEIKGKEMTWQGRNGTEIQLYGRKGKERTWNDRKLHDNNGKEIKRKTRE